MKALVHAELLKLRSSRTPVGLLLATLALVMLTIEVSIPSSGETLGVSLDDPGLLAGAVGGSFGVPQVLVMLYGVLACTQEYRYGTITSTYLGEPRRARVLLAKWLSLLIISVVLTAVTLAESVPFSIVLIRARGGDLTLAAQFWQTVVAALAVMALYGAMGVAIGALVRNQIAAVAGVLVWMLAVEQIVVTSFPEVGRWMPWGAAGALMQQGPAMSLDGRLLPATAGGLVLLGYAAVAVVLALLITPKRDVL